MSMIFILLYSSLSKQIFDYVNGFKSDELTIYLLPEDVTEIKMGSNSGAFFSQFDKNLYLDIDLIKSDGKVDTYGPFDYYYLLSGFSATENDYILRFTNEGEYSLILSIIFSVESYPNIDDYNNSDLFPFFQKNTKGQIESGIHFYYQDDKKSFVIAYVNIIPFAIYFLCILVYRCTGKENE